MRSAKIVRLLVLLGGVGYVFAPAACTLSAQPTSTQPAAPTRLVGTITAISGKSLTVKPDSGEPTTVTVADNARILETAPGAKTVAGATPIQLTDLAVGDRVLALVHPATDGSTPTATIVIAMTQADIAKVHEEEEADWQRRGTGGIVRAVDPATGTVTISTNQSRTVTIHTTPQTIIRRYAPQSIQFADAKLSTLDQIRPGDQLRALGNLSADNTEMQAEKIVAGTFHNIAGIVVSTDAGHTLTVTDLATKKRVVILINAESQLHKLPPMMAQMLAARFKNSSTGQPEGAREEHGAKGQSEPRARPANSQGMPQAGGGEGRQRMNISQVLQRTPVIQVKDLHKGDAVMIVAGQETDGQETAFTLLAGVEPIFRASSSASRNLFSASWDLGGQGGTAAAGSDSGGGGSQGR